MEQRLKDNDNKMSKPNISLIETSEIDNRDLRKDTTWRGNIDHFLLLKKAWLLQLL